MLSRSHWTRDAGDGDRALQRVDRCRVAELVAQGGQQPVLGAHDLFAGVEDQEAAGAVGVLRLAGAEGGLAERCRLLVAEDAGDRHLAQQLRGVDLAVDLGGGLDFRQHAARNAEVGEDLVVPGEGFQVHEHGARGVGDIGDVHAAVGAAGQVPGHPGVGVAEEQVPGLGGLAGAVDVVEDPLDLGAGEVRRQRQADAFLVAVHAPVGREFLDDVLGAGVLPDDGVVNRNACLLVPDHRCFTLVGDADGRNVVAGQVSGGQGDGDDFAHVVPDFGGVVLNPSRLREDLLVFHLARGNDGACVVEHDGTGTGGSLVNGDDVLGHAGGVLSTSGPGPGCGFRAPRGSGSTAGTAVVCCEEAVACHAG